MDKADEVPVIKSLFDVKGNSKYKAETKSMDEASSSNSEEEESKGPNLKSAATKHVFPTIVQPKFGVSAVFAPS